MNLNRSRVVKGSLLGLQLRQHAIQG